MKQISACILCHEWHPRLPEVLSAASRCTDEILLGYNGDQISAGQLRSLEQTPGVRIVPLPWQGYGATKNALASKASSDWIFSLDADEVPNEKLITAIINVYPDNPDRAYTITRRNYLGTQPIRFGAWGQSTRFTRLYHRKRTEWSTRAVHEAIRVKPGMQLCPLDGKLLHYTAADYATFLRKNLNYARLAAGEKKGFSPFKQWLSPAFTFLKEYIFQLGFLDGKAGLLIAAGNARYKFRKNKRS